MYITDEEEECDDIHISLCEDLPYNITKFPNWLHHKTQNEAELALQQFIPFINSECSEELKPFLCAIFVPQCPADGENITKPCKELCVKSRTGCEIFMNRIGMEWPEILSCDSLPDDDACFNIKTKATPGDIEFYKCPVFLCINTSQYILVK